MKNKFIGTLKIPCYDNCKLFYYYDVLEALSRHLFQNIIFQKAEIISNEELIKERKKFANSKANSEDSQDKDDKKEESVSDFFSDDSESEEEMTDIQLEDKSDMLKRSLEDILFKLEEKGGDANQKI